MRTTRLGAVLASLAITTGIVTVLADGPTQADTPTATTATLAISQQTTVKGQYGDPHRLPRGQHRRRQRRGVFAGSAVLQRRLPGKSWVNVKTDGDGTDGSLRLLRKSRQGQPAIPAPLPGGTDAVTSVTYAPAYSNVVTVITLWASGTPAPAPTVAATSADG
jgi:hypothetical protein